MMRAIKMFLALTLAFAVRSPISAQSPALAPVPAAQTRAAAARPPVPPTVPAGGAPLNQADVNAWLDGFMPFALARNDIAGAVVVVVKDGQVLTQKGYGFADVARRRRVDPATTLFRIGSVSKLFTWTAVMQLVEQGRLDLDRDISAYLDFRIPPLDGKPITLRNVLTHTAGFEESIRYLITNDPKRLLPLGEFVKAALPDRVFAPGTTPAYSNYATALAGYVVARAAGVPFDEYIERRVLAPIGINNSTFRQPLPAAMAGRMSLGYRAGSGDAVPFEIVVPAPAGSFSANGADMARFMLAHLADGRGLLRPETARLMHRTQFKAIPPLNGMALGFYEQRLNDRRTVGHGGDTELFHSDLWLVPSERLGVFISLNSSGTPGGAFAIRKTLFDQFGDRYFPGGREASRVDAATARRHAQEMAGSYTSSRGGFTNFVRILDFLGQAEVGVDAKGGLVTASVPGFANQQRKWVEIAPYVWRDLESGERLAAKLENGRPVRWSFDIVSPFTVFDRTPWYLDAAWLMPVALASLGVVFLAALGWPVGAFARRRYGIAHPLEGRARRVQRATHALAWAALAALGAWAAFFAAGLSSLEGFSGTYDWLLLTAQILTPIALVGLFGLAAWNMLLVWRGQRGWFAKLWSVLLLLAAAVLLWVAFGFNLIDFGFDY